MARVRPRRPPLTAVERPCLDCGLVGTYRVAQPRRPPQVPYLCAACLDARVARLKATPRPPVRPGRGRKARPRAAAAPS